jgi:cytochrome c peroxidase
MHNGALRNLEMVVNHYNQLPIEILDSMLYFNSMDPRLRPNGNLQNLNLTQAERDALVAFLLTLTGSEVYTDPRWSDPFDSNGNLNILNSTLSIEEDLWEEDELEAIQLYPNPTAGELNIDLPAGEYEIRLRDIKGVLLQKLEAQESTQIMMTDYPAGLYFIQLTDPLNNRVKIKKIIKN